MSDIKMEPKKENDAESVSTIMVQITTDKTGPKLVCPICSKALISLNGYVKHMKKHQPPGGYLCSYCDERFCLADHLEKHKDEKHKTLACRICHETFDSPENYRNHINQIHQGIDRQMIKCDKCGMEFKAAQAAKRHKETQCGVIKPHLCDQCPMAFYTKYNLAEHKKIHTGEKKFCCSYCGKSFMNKGRLVIHERSHTGEKPYKCDVCGKCFAHRESIVTHSSIHTGVKLVVCKCCGSRFSCHSNLIKHRRTRPETCGLPIYNSTLKTKRNGNSRIPPGLMASEIKIVRASKVIKPNEEQKKPKVTSCYEDEKKPKVVRTKAKIKKPKSESEGEEVIVARPRLGRRTKKLASMEEVDVSRTEQPLRDFDSEKDCDDPSFEKLMLSDSSFGSKKPIVKAESTDKILIDVPLKTEEEQKTEDFFSDVQRKPTVPMPRANIKKPNSESEDEDLIVVRPRLGLRLKEPAAIEKVDVSRSKSPLMDFDSDNDCDDPSFDNTMYSDDSSDSEKPLVKSECRDNILFDIPLKTEEEQIDNSFSDPDQILNMFLAEATYDVKDEPHSTDVKEESEDKKDDSIFNPYKVEHEDKNENKILTKRTRKRKSDLVHDNTNNADLGVSESPTKRTRKRKTDLVHEDPTDNTNPTDSERPSKRRQRSSLRHKLRFFKKDRVYDCKFCVKVYHIRKPYEKHLRVQHKITEKELQELFGEEDHDIPENYVLRCPICSKVYLMAKRLQTHITFHGPDGSLVHKCPCYCNIYFRTKEEAMEHAKEKHKEVLYCNICDRYSQTPESFKTHKKTHFEARKQIIRNLICDKCAKSFASRTSLNDHTRSNCGKDPLYQCELCDKKFSTAGILKTHSLLHKDETPYACDTCGKTFKIKAQYKTHIKMKHTDKKPFQCALCPKAYPYRESLLTHMTVHTGLKRYSCNGCSKRFTCISNLQAHRKVYADTCGVHPLNSKPSTYLGVQKGTLLMGLKPSF